MRFVVVSGLPASGKSTLARAVAPALGLPVLDKDVFLEALLRARGAGDAAWRTALSREADRQFEATARQAKGALLVSWWRHPRAVSTSGTAIEWLKALDGRLVELHCACAPDIAADRFIRRSRHPGHRDSVRSFAELCEEFQVHADLGALGLGTVVAVASDQLVDLPAVIEAVERGFAAPRSNDGW